MVTSPLVGGPGSGGAGMADPPRRRIWVQDAVVGADALQARVDAARAQGLTPSTRVTADAASHLIAQARDAALGRDPKRVLFFGWWRGTQVEAAYRSLHAARALSLDLVDDDELAAEIPAAVARVRTCFSRDDPRCAVAARLEREEPRRLRAQLRQLMNDTYQVLDGKYAQLRSFRNILLLTAAGVLALVIATLVVVWRNPGWLPMCFAGERTTPGQAAAVEGFACPTGFGADIGPAVGDVAIVALLGALGGALSAVWAIRGLKGTSTPYDVPVALAVLKVPLGALTAVLAIVLIQGEFVPGLTALDSQGQILAYAVVFGFAQQAFTRLLDQRAQTLLEDLPGGETAEAQPPIVAQAPRRPSDETETAAAPSAAEADGSAAEADLPSPDVEMVSSDEPVELPVDPDDEAPEPVVPEDENVDPDPLTDQPDDQLQDDVPDDDEPPPVPDDDLGGGGAAADAPAAAASPTVEADLPAPDVEVVSSDEPVELPVDPDAEAPEPVVPEDEIVDPDPLTDQPDDQLQDDVPEDGAPPPDDGAPPSDDDTEG